MRRVARAVVLALWACSACGGSPAPAKGRALTGAPLEHDLEATDVLPVDLDLVVRVDIGRMRSGIGPAAADALARRAVESGAEPELREALACADVVWIAAHAAEVDGGDRVIVVEGRRCMPELEAARWARVRSANGRLRIFDRRDEAPRGGTARIMNLGNKATVFVSPVELDAVKRVLDAGPDERRGNPTAEGLLSFDLRARRLPPALEKKYPSIAAVLAGVERVRGSAALVDEGLKIDAEVLGKTPAGAALAAKFLDALRESLLPSARFGEVAKQAHVEQVERAVRVKLTVPAKLVLGLLSGSEGPGSLGAEPPSSKGPAAY
jgi:hypothetical protein